MSTHEAVGESERLVKSTKYIPKKLKIAGAVA